MKKIARFNIFIFSLYIVFGVFFARLLGFYVFNHKSALITRDARLSLSENSPAQRGEIRDRNGITIAGNKIGYMVRIKKGSSDSVATTVKNLAKISGNTEEEILDDMEKENFSYYNPYIFEEDAPAELITKIKETPDLFPSVEIKEVSVRKYFYPDLCVHLLGRCGKVTESDLARGYSLTDFIGKQGAEKAFEEHLRGTDGKSAVVKSTSRGEKTFTEDTPSKSGKNVYLTIDINLQKDAEQALKDVISRSRGATAGAVVITDVASGEILALASYPSYNIEDFSKNYNKLLNDKNKPLFNRATAGLYEPGSTFKPITAIASMEAGTLIPSEFIHTKGKYEYYDRAFRCNIYRETGKTHGRINVAQALGVSCNYFFYELGHRTGIDKIAETAHLFGLDSATGIELSQEEAIGKIAHPDNRSSHWYAGDTLQAAIGQSDNRFTPLALANYAAAIANGGTLYSAHILKSVDDEKVTPTVKNKISISNEALTAIRQGMLYVTQKGTAKSVFSDFRVSVSGKTGTSQVSGKTNGLFIGFAPSDAPEIAFCAVVEGAPSGNTAAEVVKNAIPTYFNIQTKGN